MNTMNTAEDRKRPEAVKIDWSKYPPLPEPPQLPAWRDAPEREAYWNERSGYSFREVPFGRSVWLSVFLTEAVLLYVFAHPLRDKWFYAALFALVFSLPVMAVYGVGARMMRIWKLNRKYGGYPGKERHPDLSPQIATLLAARPEYTEEEFRRLWPTEEHARIALFLMKNIDFYRRSPRKLLYPNDPLLLFLYGREWRWGKSKICFPPDPFYEDAEDVLRFPAEEWEKLDLDAVTLGEIVERCLEAASTGGSHV